MMLTNEPIEVNLPEDTNIMRKVLAFLGHYDLRVYVTDEGYVDIGRGSLCAATHIVHVMDEYKGCIGEVGQFCDFATSCKLYGGGQHNNDLPVNVVMSNIPMFQKIVMEQKIDSLRPKPQKPFKIGNAVVVSGDAIVLPGAEIEDGAVVGAGAVVSGKIPAFTTCVGVPARGVKYRVGNDGNLTQFVRWWDFDTVYIANNLTRIQELAIHEKRSDHIYRKPTPRFILKLMKLGTKDEVIQILGFLENDKIKPITAASKKVFDYVAQIGKPGPYKWIANVWED